MSFVEKQNLLQIVKKVIEEEFNNNSTQKS